MFKALFLDREYKGSVNIPGRGKISARTEAGEKIDVYDIKEQDYKELKSNKNKTIKLSTDYKDILVGSKKIRLSKPKTIPQSPKGASGVLQPTDSPDQ